MTAPTLPKRLKKEPLVDAIFEIRFSSSTEASSVLPGFFYARLKPKEWQVEHLPISEFPSQVRHLEPNLRFLPLIRLHWGNFVLLIGDNAFGIGCKMPYSGWDDFKKRIIGATEILIDAEIIMAIERYSIKYVNVIAGESLAEQIQGINVDIRVGSHTLKQETFNVRLEVPHDDFINVIQIAAPARAKMLDGRELLGTLIDMDTVCNHQTNDLVKFTNELPDRAEAIHAENKDKFFECLKPETIRSLEPEYE